MLFCWDPLNLWNLCNNSLNTLLVVTMPTLSSNMNLHEANTGFLFSWATPSSHSPSSTFNTFLSSSGLPRWLSGKAFTIGSAKRCRRLRFSPCIGKIPWRRKWQVIPVFFLANPMDRGVYPIHESLKESDMTFASKKQQQQNQGNGVERNAHVMGAKSLMKMIKIL